MRITEIYASIQGETQYAGLPCTLVRTTGCDLRCTYCDSAFAFHGGDEMTLPEILAAVRALGAPLVLLTGGEPMLQREIASLADLLLQAGYRVMIETSGSHAVDSLPEAVVRIIDVKMEEAIKAISTMRGHDLRDFMLLAFGGAGPVHAAGFATELGIKQIYIFATSPVFSAFGAAAADVIRTRVMSCQYILPADPAVVNQRLDAIESEMKAAMTGEGFKPNQVEFRRFFTMRYRRQTAGVEMPVSWDRFNAKVAEKTKAAAELVG